MTTSLLTLGLMAWNNVFAGGKWGGKWWDDKVPGRALYPAILVVFLVSLLLHPWLVSLALAAAFGFWRSFSWGMLIGLGRHIPNRPKKLVESFLYHTFGPHGGLFARHLFILPGLALVAYLTGTWALVFFSVPFAALAVGAYELGWRVGGPSKAIPIGEMLTGFLWAIIIIGISL